MSDSIELGEFLDGYLSEVDEHLSTANTNLLTMADSRAGEPNPRSVRELFRALHTIKGLSAMVGIEPVVAISHVMETVLRNAGKAAGKLPPGGVDVLLRGVRAIEQRIQALARKQPVAAAPQALLEALEALELAKAAPVQARATLFGLAEELVSKLAPSEHEQLTQGLRSGRRALEVEFIPSPAKATEGLNITSLRERVGKVGEIVKVVPQHRAAQGDTPGGLAFLLLVVTDLTEDALAESTGLPRSALRTLSASAPEAPVIEAPAQVVEEEEELGPSPDEIHRQGFVRVAVGRLDTAMERLSAVVVNRFRLNRTIAELHASGVDVRELRAVMGENGRLLRDLRAAIMRVRMVPMSELLARVPLLVRGLRRTTGKSVRVELEAGRAELDKTVAERIFPAIVHLIRNAIDHGIEDPGARIAAGKPEEGVVRLTCFERSNNQLELSISDDGRGVDAEALARRAGRPVPEGEGGLLELLTLPGLSSRDEATTTSGRGLGMDIVKRVAVDELGGELAMRTVPGRGTTFILRVPLTVSIVDSFSFSCGDSPFVTPVASVEEIIELDVKKMRSSPRRAGAHSMGIVERRGEAVPVIALDELFSLPRVASGRQKALVVRRNGEPYAFSVDRMLGQQEVVVRPLDDPLVRTVGVSGATDLGDGRPTLVLDFIALSASLQAFGERHA